MIDEQMQLIFTHKMKQNPFLLFLRSADMWGLGCLIWEVFNGQLNDSMALQDTKKVMLLTFIQKHF